MTVHIHLRDQEFDVPSRITIRSTFLLPEIHPEAVPPALNGGLLTEDEILQEGDEVPLITVNSGGEY